MINKVLTLIPKILLFLCLILTALVIKLNSDLSKKDSEIAHLELDRVVKAERLDRIEKQLTMIEVNVQQARDSWIRLNSKVTEIEGDSTSYQKEVKKAKTKDEEIKSVLDTKLPSDIKRLLNEATRTSNSN